MRKITAMDPQGNDSCCRLCASTSADLVRIYNNPKFENDLADRINMYLPVNVAITDTLPLFCCIRCANTLTDFHHLVLKCLDTDNQLTRDIRAMEASHYDDFLDDHTYIDLDIPGPSDVRVEYSLIKSEMISTSPADKKLNLTLIGESEFLRRAADDNDDYVLSNDENHSSEGTRENNEDNQNKRETRKRIRREENWVNNVKKKCRAAGKEYKTITGKTVIPKMLKPPCKCKRKCYELLSTDQRKTLFEAFYALDYNSQSQFISNTVKEYEKSRKTIKNVIDSRRKYSRSYFMKNTKSKVQEVCQIMFLNTFDLTLKRVRSVMEKCRKSELGICGPDERGKHTNHKTVPEEQRKGVCDHITRFPTYDGPSSRSHTKKKYLASDLSIQQMYRLYLRHCEETAQEPVSKFFYRHIFVSQFNLTFLPPKKRKVK